MMKILFGMLVFLFQTSVFANSSTGNQKFQSLYDFKVNDIYGKPFDLSQLKGKVTLIVNTASKCGFTPQFKDLEEIQQKYGSKGFQVLAFPSNDFRQDQGSNESIASFAKDEYKVSFPLMEKNPVTGDQIQPVFRFLTESHPGILFKNVQWNFEKFLVGKDGKVIDRWNSTTRPNSKDITSKIEKAL